MKDIGCRTSIPASPYVTCRKAELLFWSRSWQLILIFECLWIYRANMYLKTLSLRCYDFEWVVEEMRYLDQTTDQSRSRPWRLGFQYLLLLYMTGLEMASESIFRKHHFPVARLSNTKHSGHRRHDCECVCMASRFLGRFKMSFSVDPFMVCILGISEGIILALILFFPLRRLNFMNTMDMNLPIT